MIATITVHDDATPSAHYPSDEQTRNGAVDISVTVVIAGEIVHCCDVCGVSVDGEGAGCACDRPSGNYSSIITRAPRTIAGEITLYRDDANGGRLGTCGTPLDVWCSASIVQLAHTLTDRSRRDLLASLASGAGSEEIEIEVRS